MHKHRVRALLVRGQACVLYGAAEFSRDTDFAIVADAANLARLRRALADLRAAAIAIPPLRLKYLKRGHAAHFRCYHPEALGMRVDIMSRMRGVAEFKKLWRRRTSIELPDGLRCELLSLQDLVCAKKTQRDKDWPMIRRLVEAHYFQNRAGKPASKKVRFWLLELRTPSLLIDVARAHFSIARELRSRRPLLASALAGDLHTLEQALASEELTERSRDKEYWAPLRKELERFRHALVSSKERGRQIHQQR